MPSFQVTWDWMPRRTRAGSLRWRRSGVWRRDSHGGRERGPRPAALIGSAALGGGLMYLLDPDRGRRRRALLRDKLLRTAHRAGDALDATACDTANRARGLVAGTRLRLLRGGVDDTVLVARVRAALGGVVSHPRAIEVSATNGRVTLSGPILAHEVAGLLSRVSTVPGVAAVENHLEVHEQAGDVPGLQGGPARREEQLELAQRQWSPTARLLAAAGGGALAVCAARRRGPLGAALATVGLGLLARGVTNLPLKRLVGLGAGRHVVELQKTIAIDAPVEQVFELWSHYENFPRFMSHVREVRGTPNGQSHWVAVGPAGTAVEWDAVVTRYETNRVLAWKTLPSSIVAHSGIVRFEPTPDGGTRLDVKLSYTPPTGAIGHAVAALFGVDPKQAMDEDLVRLKSLLETGKATAHGQEVTRAQLATEPGETVPLRHVG